MDNFTDSAATRIWNMTTLGDVCEKPQYGFTATAQLDAVGPHYLRITDLQNGTLDWRGVPYCKIEEDNIDRYLLKSGDLVVARIGATTGKTSLIKISPKAVFASYLIRLRPKKEVNPSFLFFFTQSQGYWSWINANKDNNLKGGVNASLLSQIELPFPPKPEQEKIAKVLYKVQQAIEIEETLISTTRDLKKSAMHQLFTKGLRGEKQKETEIGLVPENWSQVLLGDFGEVVTGTTPKTAQRRFYDNGIYHFIAPGDLGKSTKIYSAEKLITEDGLSVSRVLPKNTVCFVCIGSSIGKIGITTQDQSTTNQQINSIISNNKFDPFYVCYLLSYFSRYLSSFSSPSPVPIMSKGKFLQIPIYTSLDKNEQIQIAEILQIIDAKIEFHERKKSTLQELFQSLLLKLMTGEIRVNDLNIDVSEII